MKRRAFLKLGAAGIVGSVAAASGVLTWVPRARAATIDRIFYIRDGYIAQPDGRSVYFRGYASDVASLNVPGQSMVAQEGDMIRITLINTLATSHGFYIMGLCNSGPIAPGESRTVEFVASKAGSYLFYDNVNLPYNRLLGLHGGLAVMPSGRSDELYAGSPKFKQQLFWVFNDIDPVWHEELRLGRTPSTRFIPRYFTINGLSSRPPDAPDHDDPDVDAFAARGTALHGRVGDRTLIRVLNAGLCMHSIHWHGNHVEWLTKDGQIRAQIWKKDVVRLENNVGGVDVIYPFEAPPDAWPTVTSGQHYVMHLHDEQTQTAGGGLYQFGAATHIMFM